MPRKRLASAASPQTKGRASQSAQHDTAVRAAPSTHDESRALPEENVPRGRLDAALEELAATKTEDAELPSPPGDVLDHISAHGVSWEMSRVCVAWRASTRRVFVQPARPRHEPVHRLPASAVSSPEKLQVLRLQNAPHLSLPSSMPSLRNLLHLSLPWSMSLLRYLLSLDCPHIACLPDCTSLRTLTLDYCPKLRSLPDCESLRTLELHRCPELTSLPDFTSLRTLMLDNCLKLTSLPNFTSLRTLKLHWCPELTSLPDFTSLRTLTLDYCPKLTSLPDCESLRTLKLHWCRELTSLSDLHMLEHVDLYNVGSRSLPTRLSHLQTLRLVFCGDVTLPASCDYPKLEDLYISSCPLIREIAFPTPNLTALYLEDVDVERLPDLHMLEHGDLKNVPLRSIPTRLSHLQTLRLVFCGDVTLPASCDYPKLEDLYISSCPLIREIAFPTPNLTALCLEAVDVERRVESLRTLTLDYCPKLTSLPDCESLRTLKLHWCRELTSLSDLHMLEHVDLYNVGLRSLPTRLSHLKKLVLNHCDNMFLPASCDYPKLEDLYINRCPLIREIAFPTPNLTALHLEDVHVERLPAPLDRLTRLELNVVPVSCLPELPSLVTLELHQCNSLTTLPARLDALEELIIVEGAVVSLTVALPRLKKLHISHAPSLRELPAELPSLTHLSLANMRWITRLPSYPGLVHRTIIGCRHIENADA